jgi:hypothetical protein
LLIYPESHRLLNLAGPQGRKKSMGLQEGRAHITLFLTIGYKHKYLWYL